MNMQPDGTTDLARYRELDLLMRHLMVITALCSEPIGVKRLF